jgi:hypothetical protein
VADTISLDLRTGLQMIPDDVEASADGQTCKYTTPCVVGLMMTPDQRTALAAAGGDTKSIAHLMRGDACLRVEVPTEQQDDMERLQDLYDDGCTDILRGLVATLKEKYHVQAG